MNEQLPKAKKTFYTQVIKRLLDIVLSGVAIIVLIPLFIVVYILEIKFHGSPAFFTQERVGLHKKVFKMYKFRSMTNETDENGELLPDSERLTKFGKFIRGKSIDELPQLLCIFKGDMSIIGPRPLPVEYLQYYTERHMQRHEIKPGLACMAIKPTKTWSYYDQFENDILYMQTCSFTIDVKMILAIIKEIISPSDFRKNATREHYNGKNLYVDANDKTE